MTLEERRVEFVRRAWDYVIPQSRTAYYFLDNWIPAEILAPLGKELSRVDLEKVELSNDTIGLLCFAKLHRSISRNWSKLQPEFAALILELLDRLQLWEGFERSKISLSEEKRDITKVRFDVADVIFASKEPLFRRRLEQLSVDVEQTLMQTNADNNEEQIIDAVQSHVKLRSHIDLSILTVQNIQRRAAVVSRIAARTRIEIERQFFFLRNMLKNSMLWETADGKLFLGANEVPLGHSNEMNRIVDKRLDPFNQALNSFLDGLRDEIPPKELLEECSDAIRKITMPSQNNTTNIQITNSQIGLLNTGTLRDVESIDASITTLKSEGDMEIGDAFKKITEEAVRDSVLSETDKAELLSNTKYLSDLAAKKSEPKNHSVIRSVARSVSDGLSMAGPALKALLPLMPIILKHFGL